MFGPTISDIPPDPMWKIPYPPPGKVLVDAAFMAKVRETIQYIQIRGRCGYDVHDRINELAAMLPPETAP